MDAVVKALAVKLYLPLPDALDTALLRERFPDYLVVSMLILLSTFLFILNVHT